MNELTIPALSEGCTVLQAAFAYADAGWYVLPVEAGSKHPGSVVGGQWHAKSTRDHKQIAAWFTGQDYGIALHVGRSGAFVVDVDRPESVPAVLREAIEASQAPYQSTRVSESRRGHYVFRMPAGRVIGNSTGKLGKGWGEIRGANGVIIVAPSQHEKAEQGGRYEWLQTGQVPDCPGYLAALLPDSRGVVNPATDARVHEFMQRHTAANNLDGLDWLVQRFNKSVEDGESRHESAVQAMSWAMKRAAAGEFPARQAYDEIGRAFAASLQGEPKRHPRSEFDAITAWAIGCADAEQTEHDTEAAEAETPEDAETAAEDATDAPEDELPGKPKPVNWRAVWSSEAQEDWIVEPLISAGRATAIYSAPKTGKSLLLLEIAAAVAMGYPVLGVQTKQRRVMYVDHENDVEHDVVPRLKSMGYTEDDLDTFEQWFTYYSFPVLAKLDTRQGGQELFELAQECSAELVVIDTISRAVGGEENSNDTWLDFYRHTGLLFKRANIALVRLDHTGKNAENGPRGGSAKTGDVDATWLLNRKSDTVYRLSLDSARMPIPTESRALVLHRMTEPALHHAVEGKNAEPSITLTDIDEVILWLDKLGVPPERGWQYCAQALRDNGWRGSNSVIKDAVRERKHLADHPFAVGSNGQTQRPNNDWAATHAAQSDPTSHGPRKTAGQTG